ncbi:hypothetical protein [Nonomuraea sp. NPDC050643]|uniref:hypothetical protein n=1 Tax=Nonomuraea sp. NPDC050643 TaxID=3155660 RepID=UPI0033E92030
MISEGQDIGQVPRAALAALALAAAAVTIYLLFSTGFGRPPSAAMEPPRPAPPPRAPGGVTTLETALGVVSGDFWLTALPKGLEREGGGAIAPRGGWARFGSAAGFVEARVDHGDVAAGWNDYRGRISLLNARPTTVRGRPAVAGRHPAGGRVIAWLEREGTGAWIRVSDSFGRELVALAASVQAPVGD